MAAAAAASAAGGRALYDRLDHGHLHPDREDYYNPSYELRLVRGRRGRENHGNRAHGLRHWRRREKGLASFLGLQKLRVHAR